MPKKRKTSESAAILTIKDAADMTPQGARDIAAWLERQASMLRKSAERKMLASRFTARYMY